MATHGPDQPERKPLSDAKEGNTTSRSDGDGRCGNRSTRVGPNRAKWGLWVIVVGTSLILLFLSAFVAIQFLSDSTHDNPIFEHVYLSGLSAPSALWLTYVALGLIPVSGVGVLWGWHKHAVHKRRRSDRSEVEATILEAKYVEPRLGTRSAPEKPEDYEEKKNDLDKEVCRLRGLGHKRWTEYQVLCLNQMLVDFFKVDDLIATAQLKLDALKDYAGDEARRYDWEAYFDWKEKIDDAIDEIEEVSKPSEAEKAQTDVEGLARATRKKRDDAGETLRAQLRALMEHVASYEELWAKGSAMMGCIIIWGLVAILVAFGMGLLPIFHPGGNKYLAVLNWGLLGVVGSLTVVLANLHKSDLVAVGEMEGRRELWRTALSVPLGFTAGILGCSLITGQLLNPGGAVPNVVYSPNVSPNVAHEISLWRHIALSVLWGFASGFCFEKVFDRVVGATTGRRE